MQGAYIASSPNPVSQRDFMKTLRRVVGMPIGLPAFSWMVRIGAPLLMRTDPELACMEDTWYRNVFNRKGSSFSFLIWKMR